MLLEPGLLEPGQFEPGLFEPDLLEPGLLEPGLLEPGLLEPSLLVSGLLEPGLLVPDLLEPGLLEPSLLVSSLLVPDLLEPGLLVCEPGVMEHKQGLLSRLTCVLSMAQGKLLENRLGNALESHQATILFAGCDLALRIVGGSSCVVAIAKNGQKE